MDDSIAYQTVVALITCLFCYRLLYMLYLSFATKEEVNEKKSHYCNINSV